MRAEQTVNEMAEEVLWRQARALAQRTGEPLVEALEAVLDRRAEKRTTPKRGDAILAGQSAVRARERAGRPSCTSCKEVRSLASTRRYGAEYMEGKFSEVRNI
jgi:hypothetical protein